MATRKPTRRPGIVAAVNSDYAHVTDAEQAAKEHATFLAAGQDPAIVGAAGITNGMPADEIKRRILAVIFAVTPTEG